MAGRLRVDWPTFWGALAFLLVGGGFALFGGHGALTTAQFLRAAQPVEAIVVDDHKTCESDGCTWRPALAFTDPATQETRILRTRYGSSDYGWQAGAKIEALHNPAYDHLRIPGVSNLWVFPLGFLLLGLFAAGIGLWLMVRLVFSRSPAEK